MPDPKDKELEGVRAIRDAIQEKVERLLVSMLPDTLSPRD